MKKIKLGLGFATGRKSFRKVLSAYIINWAAAREKIPSEWEVSLHLFVAYDLDYLDTKSTDYTNLSQEIVDMFDDIVFYGAKNAMKSIENLNKNGAFTSADLRSVFGAGYAGKRNSILYAALENQIDYLLFLDDDEYPVAVTNNHDLCLWSGQHLLLNHLQEIQKADYTNGHHCGYVSPIPQIDFNETLTEADFKAFIEAISNDAINWEHVKQLMETGGVTYASTDILRYQSKNEVPEVNGCRFISGANLCINLNQPRRTFPFYNPPGARGEDTFLSTLLHERTVHQIPCYAFHDGFHIYRHLLDGVLPTQLSPIKAISPDVVSRFLGACIGWVRYKPLLVYITRPDEFDHEMEMMYQTLLDTLPKLAAYFKNDLFEKVLAEFEKYRDNVKKHKKQFDLTLSTWDKLITLTTEK